MKSTTLGSLSDVSLSRDLTNDDLDAEVGHGDTRAQSIPRSSSVGDADEVNDLGKQTF